MNQTRVDDATPIYGLTSYIQDAVNRPLAADVSARTRQHLLDTIAAMVSGAHLIAGRAAIAFVKTQGGPPQAHVVGSSVITTAINAACTNGMLAHADETDDHHLGSITHPGSSIVPAALAVAELTGASGAQLLSAVALGYDVAARIGVTLTNRLFFEGVSMPSFGGGFGAAAAAGGLLKLGAAQLRFVMSYVAQQTSGARSWQRDPDHMEKAFVISGAPARNAVTAALMVQCGFNGVADVFSGDFNFFAMHSPQADLSQLTRGLGEKFEIMHTSMKKFCVGGPIQAPLEGLSVLLEQGLAAADIERVDIRIAANHASVVDNRDNPSICVQHILALLLVDGKIDFESCHDMGRLNDPAVRRERAKINLIYDKEMEGVAPRRPVDVAALLRDGTSRVFKADAVRGTAYNPMTQQEVEAKAMELMTPVLGSAQARIVCEKVAALDRAAEIGSLAQALTLAA